jgi:hypothetical protein
LGSIIPDTSSIFLRPAAISAIPGLLGKRTGATRANPFLNLGFLAFRQALVSKPARPAPYPEAAYLKPRMQLEAGVKKGVCLESFAHFIQCVGLFDYAENNGHNLRTFYSVYTTPGIFANVGQRQAIAFFRGILS